MTEHTLHEYSVRGHEFTIIETSQAHNEGSIQVFAIYSAGKLIHHQIAKHSLPELLNEIDSHLPQWIEKTRREGHSVMGYDPRAPITELPR